MTDNMDPLAGFHFGLEVKGVLSGYFTHVGGLGSENELIEHKVVDEKGREITRMISGRLKWTPVTLKRGVTKNLDIWKWRQDVVDGKMEAARKNASILAFDDEGTLVARWDMTFAWPSKVVGPEMDSTTGNVMFEEVTIVYESVKRTEV